MIGTGELAHAAAHHGVDRFGIERVVLGPDGSGFPHFDDAAGKRARHAEVWLGNFQRFAREGGDVFAGVAEVAAREGERATGDDAGAGNHKRAAAHALVMRCMLHGDLPANPRTGGIAFSLAGRSSEYKKPTGARNAEAPTRRNNRESPRLLRPVGALSRSSLPQWKRCSGSFLQGGAPRGHGLQVFDGRLNRLRRRTAHRRSLVQAQSPWTPRRGRLFQSGSRGSAPSGPPQSGGTARTCSAHHRPRRTAVLSRSSGMCCGVLRRL